MKVELSRVAKAIPHMVRAPKLVMALAALALNSAAIDAIRQYESYPLVGLILIGTLAVLSLIFVYRSFEKL